MQSKRYIHFNQELQITAGHVLMSDYNLLMSIGIRPEIGYDDRTNHIAKTAILRLKICTIITVRLLESGHSEEDYQITNRFLKTKNSQVILSFITLRAVSCEVRKVQTVLKFSTIP